MNHIFNNKVFIEPSADAVVNFDSSPTVAALGSSTVLILAEAAHGLDYSDRKVYEFTSVADARKALKSGPGVELCQIVFAPSGQTPGASKVLFVKTNKSECATAKFATGAVMTATYTLTLADGMTDADVAGRIGFKMTVNGRTMDMTADIIGTSTGTGLDDAIAVLCGNINTCIGVQAFWDKTTHTLSVQGDNAAVTISLASPFKPYGCASVSVVNPSTTPSYVASTVKTLEKGADLEYSVKIDKGVATFYKGSDASREGIPFSVLGLLEDVATAGKLKDAVENHAVLGKLFTVEIGSESDVLDTDGAVIPFTVAEDTPVDLAAFAEALSISAKYDKTAIISDQTGEAYHLLMAGYANNESEYRCDAIIGREIGKTPNETMSYAATFNSENVILAYPGVYLNFTGETKLYPATYFAAAVAGIEAGLQCQEPLTRKTVQVLGFEEVDFEGQSEKAVREEMINKGVLFGYYTDSNGYNILKGINTIQNQNIRSMLGTDNRTHEISIARIRKQMAKELRVSADAVFPGTTRLKPNSTDVANFVASYLNSKVGTYLSSWDDKSLSVRLEEDAWYVEAGCTVNGPVNFAFFTLNFTL